MRIFVLTLLATLAALPAQAYVGPGAGLGAILAMIAILLGVVLLLVGFLWYPLKRLLRGRKKHRSAEASGPPKS